MKKKRHMKKQLHVNCQKKFKPNKFIYVEKEKRKKKSADYQ